MGHCLRAENITKRVGRKEILHEISLELIGGNIYGFIGENGSGKTMLFRTLSGLVRPTRGRVLLDGKDIYRERKNVKVGVIIENAAMWPELTGIENLLFLSSLNHCISYKDVRSTMERVGLDPDNKLSVKKYSSGMKQRLNIAQAVMERPDFLFLDEPTNAIDKDGIVLIRQIIFEEAKRGAVVLLASHISQDISELCTEVYGMESGACMQIGRKKDAEKADFFY